MPQHNIKNDSKISKSRESRVMVYGISNWQEVYKDKKMHLSELSKIIQPGKRIFIGTGCSEPEILTSEFNDGKIFAASCGKGVLSVITDKDVIIFVTYGSGVGKDKCIREIATICTSREAKSIRSISFKDKDTLDKDKIYESLSKLVKQLL